MVIFHSYVSLPEGTVVHSYQKLPTLVQKISSIHKKSPCHWGLTWVELVTGNFKMFIHIETRKEPIEKNIYVCVYIYMCVCTYLYIYIYIHLTIQSGLATKKHV